MMTELEKGYFLEPVTEKGKALLKEAGCEDGTAYQEQAAKVQQAVAAEVKKPFADTAGVPEKLLSLA
jgi:hypothetical protein